MKRGLIVGVLVLAMLLAACIPTPTPSSVSVKEGDEALEILEELRGSGQCVNFRGFADGTILLNPFTLDGFTFTGLGGFDTEIDTFDGERGLRFRNDGVQIDLPMPTSIVAMLVGSWASELDIVAQDSGGNMVAQTTLPGDNNIHAVAFSDTDIATIVITGGDYEALVFTICIRAEPVPCETLCVDFSGFTEGTILISPFTLSNLTFSILGGFDPWVGIVDGEKGLQFHDDGLQIDLPSPSSLVTLRIGSWTGSDIVIEAQDSGGNVVAHATIPGDGSAHSVTLSNTDITQIVITGGGNEGFLFEICTVCD